MFWDSHCHLSDLRFSETLEETLYEASLQGIKGFGFGGYDPEDWVRQLKIIKAYPQYSFAPVFGLHPMWVSLAEDEAIEVGLDQLGEFASKTKAIGEIGLDARKLYVSGWVKQMEAFRAQLEIAGFSRKPIVLHVVRGHNEALQLLHLHRESIAGGFVHAFSGDKALAKQYLDLNLGISVGGAITHPRSHAVRDAIQWLPQERLFLETDSPDQKIEGWESSSLHRPIALWNIARVVGEIRGQTPEEILQLSSDNFCRMMRI